MSDFENFGGKKKKKVPAKAVRKRNGKALLTKVNAPKLPEAEPEFIPLGKNQMEAPTYLPPQRETQNSTEIYNQGETPDNREQPSGTEMPNVQVKNRPKLKAAKKDNTMLYIALIAAVILFIYLRKK